MSEETTFVDQEDAVSNYLTEYSLVDDDSATDAPDGEASEELELETENPEMGKNEDGKEVNDGKGGENTVENPETGVQPDEKTSQSVKHLKEIPKGFTKLFFAKDDKGAITFDRAKALAFTLPEPGKQRFTYPDNRIQFVEDKNAGAPAEPQDEYQTFVKEEKMYRDSVKGNMHLGLTKFKEVYASSNGDVNAAYQAALQEIEGVIQSDFEERDYQNQANLQKRLEEKFGTNKSQEEVNSKARSNEALLMNEIASKFNLDPTAAKESYVELMQHGLPIMRMMFEMSNPDKTKGVTVQQYNKEFGNWWNRVAADNDHLRFVYSQVLNDINTKIGPYTNEAFYSKQAKAEASRRRSRGGRPSQINRSQAKTPDAIREVEQYFGAGSSNTSSV